MELTDPIGAMSMADRICIMDRGEVLQVGAPMAGHERPARQFAGTDVTRLEPARRDVAFVFRQYSLSVHYTVFDNLAFPLRAPGRKSSSNAIRCRVHDIAAMLRIEGGERIDTAPVASLRIWPAAQTGGARWIST